MRKLAVLFFVALSALAGDAPVRESNGGISVLVPENWVRVPIAEAMQQRIDTEFADSKYERREGYPKSVPVLVMQKIPKDADPEKTPLAASMVIGRMPLPPVDLELQEIAESLAKATSDAFEGVVVEAPLTATKIGGLPGYVIKFRYTALKTDGGKMDIRTGLAMVKNGSFLFIAGYNGPSTGPEDESAAFDGLVKSIEFVEIARKP
jgi:hypothetical protein